MAISPNYWVFVTTAILSWWVWKFIILPLFVDSLSTIPGPRLYALTKWRLAMDDWAGERTRTINRLHQQYGPVVRIGPEEVHFNSVTALRTIYGAGSGFGRTNFYRMFDVYGTQNLFTFHSSGHHAKRKKLVANVYSKSMILKPRCATMVEGKVEEYMNYLARLDGKSDEIFTSLHYFSLDAISHFVYGSRIGGTKAISGHDGHRKLLLDILDPARRRLSWFAVHLPRLTRWMYTRRGISETIVTPMLPMRKPATYSGIREHALNAWLEFKKAATNDSRGIVDEPSVMNLLWKRHISQKEDGLQDLEIASECADHLLAGIDTTADTLMFLIWALSLPENLHFQTKLIEEVKGMPTSSLNDSSIPTVAAADKLTYLNAIIRETLRLYTPLPATEPRSLSTDIVIDGHLIPANTVVGMSPFTLHRLSDIFPAPLTFNPDRWLDSRVDLEEMNRWFWAFSSGARMCIGMHLAMAELTTLVATIYRTYSTSIAPSSKDFAPAITSRFELFSDETASKVKVGVFDHFWKIKLLTSK